MDWIKCSEKLPEHHEEVIFYVKSREKCFCGYFESIPKYRSLNKNKKNFFYENLDDWWFDGEDITHWMPLPKPPEV